MLTVDSMDLDDPIARIRKFYDSYSQEEQYWTQMLDFQKKYGDENHIAEAERQLSDAKMKKGWAEEIALADPSDVELREDIGQLYEVEIPDDDVLLDEQATFEKQPEAVKRALTNLSKKYGIELETKMPHIETTKSGKTFIIIGPGGWEPSGAPRFKSREKAEAWLEEHGSEFARIRNGEEIYMQLKYKLGSPKAASEALNAEGVKGITYVGGRDGRCFVIFDDKSIQMLDTFYQFLGERGAAALDAVQEVTTRMDNLGVAREMETAGKDALAIKHATGWERGADGLWRYEVMDGTLHDIHETGWVTYKLGDIFNSQELFGAYPSLRDLEVSITLNPSMDVTFSQGSYDPGVPEISGTYENGEEYRVSGRPPKIFLETRNAEETRSILLHEIQHAIQHIEGFASGGNPGMMTHRQDSRSEYEQYRALAGEVEARNVQRRMEMDMDDRREFLARETEDVAREDQIFLENGLNAASMMSQDPADYAKGMTTPLDDGRYVIQLFQAADLSTMAHEFAHAMFLDMQARVRNGMADPQTADDWQTLQEWLGQLDDDSKLKEQYDRYLKDNPAFAGREFETLDMTEKALAKSIAGQEMLARAWESYLREGNAPSKKMEGVFRRFAKWLKKVYRDLKQLDVQISDEVREVFDRMIATDDEMDAAAADAGIREETQRLLDALGLQGADRLEMEGLITAAKEEAVDKLRRARDKEWRERRARWLQEAREQVEKEQPYITKAALRKTPVDIDAIKAQLGEGVAEAMRKAMPGSLKQGGQIPDVMAAELGYDSVEAMVRDVVESPRKNERIKQIVEQTQLEHDAMFPADDFLWEQEQIAEQQTLIAKALHKKLTGERDNARKAREAQNVYRDELAGDTLNRQPVRPDEDEYQMYGKRARFYVAREAITKAAQAYLEKQDLQKAMQPGRFRTQASKWVNEERRAILKGDWEKAAEANYKARLNIELAKQAADLRDMVDKVRKQSKRWLEGDYSQALKWADEKQRDALAGARFAVLLLTQNMGLFNPTRKMLANANDKGMDDIAKFLRYAGEMGYLDVEQQPDGSVICNDIEGRLFKEAIDMKTSPTSEVRPYLEAIAQIMHIDRAERKSVTEEGKADFSEFTQDISDSILALNSRRDPGSFAKRNAFIQMLREFHTAHLKADTILMLLDGDDMGPAWQAIMRPINRATWWRADRLKKEGQALKQLFSVYTRKELVDMKGKRYFVQAIGESITKEQALAILLNCGNADNLQRVMAGFKLKNGNTLTEAQVAAIIDTLDEKDVKFAQSVWDYFETFRKESFDLQESITGVRPEAVQAQPLRTKYGELRGGYYPIVYDKTQSAKPIDTETIGTQTGGMWASVDYGSMKQRTATGLGTALSLSIDVIPQHVARTVHMLAFRKPVIEVSRILNAKNVNSAIQETAGVETTKALQSWLHYVAGERPAKTGWSKACAWARRNAGLYTMGFKLTTMLAQMTGLLATTAELGPTWTMVGVFQTVRAPLEAWHLATTSSAMMRHRIHAVDREVWEQSTKMMDTGSTNRIADPLVRIKRKLDDNAYVPMGWVQMIFADMPTWQGAYAKAMHENGGDMKAAAEYADAMVERTQVGGSEKDLAAVQRGTELGKLMTMFYSYFSAIYQLSARRITMLHRSGYKSGAAWWRLGTLAMLTWFAEPVIAGLLTRKSPDDDDDDEWGRFNEPEFWKWAAKEALINPFNMVIGVREAASTIDGMIEGYNRGFRLSSALDVADSYTNFVRQVLKTVDTGEVDEKKLILKGGKAFGQTTGLVNAQEMLLLERIWDWLDGTDPDVELGDLIRKKKK